MKINDKLTRAITEVNYLRAENVERYRIIIRYFYEEYEKINYWLYKEDIYSMMTNTSMFENYSMEQCLSDLNSLVEWGNLTAMQDTSKVMTIDEFKNRKFRYQLSEYTIEIERMTLRLENLEVEGASLEPSLLERIHKYILDIPTLSDRSELEINTWWNDLNNDFIRLNRNYQDYIRALNSAKAEEMMKTKEFLIFKEKIITYLRSFVKSLQEHAMILEEYIKEIPQNTIQNLIEKAIKYELSIPRIDMVIDEDELRTTYNGRWKSIYNWFVGKNGISEVSRMSDITNDIIRRITRYAQQISEYHNQGANTIEEYRHLANIFSQCKSLDEAHKMSAMVFGVDRIFHIKNLNTRDTDSIDSGVYEEASTFYTLEPRIRTASTKTKRKPATDYTFEKNLQAMEILNQQEHQQEILKKFIEQQIIDFAKIDYLDSYSRKLLLSWLSRGLQNKDHRAKIESGEYYTINTDNQSICKVECEDGTLFMPAFKICFEKEREAL